MSTRSTAWEQGTPNWVDLATNDMAATTAFYTALLGWEVRDMGAEFGHYSICTRRGLATAGIGPVMAEGQPCTWTTYLAVDDLDKTVQAVTEHGGTVVSPPMLISDQGRMAVAIDPTGAAFGLWETNKMIGCELVNEPGGVSWNDHHSADPEAARTFYSAVLGYRYTAMDGPLDYATINGAGPGDTVGGIGALAPEEPGTPAHWMTYFAVDDTDAACATATELGGAVLAPGEDTPFGRMAKLSGPEGATFMIVGISPEVSAQM